MTLNENSDFVFFIFGEKVRLSLILQRVLLDKEKQHIIVIFKIFVVLKLKVSMKDVYRCRVAKGLNVLIICLLFLIL